MSLNVSTPASMTEYLTGVNYNEYLDYLHQNHPKIYNMLDIDFLRSDSMKVYVDGINNESWEFEVDGVGGRGIAYNYAQRSIDNRRIGMEYLINLFDFKNTMFKGGDFFVLDVLGGDGTVARFAKTMEIDNLNIITADISKYMIDKCYSNKYSCVRQSATRSLFRNDVLDGVLIAYGSHHIAGEDREIAVREAHRTLKPGGIIAFHDFEIGKPSANWFEAVVHPYSRTGHPHPHFTREELKELFVQAGFRDFDVFDMHDPFTLRGRTPDEAKENAIMHLYYMYDLIKIGEDRSDIVRNLEPIVEGLFGAITIEFTGSEYCATVARDALVAVGKKS
ncbi:class I SAM-dependent methyltransferase [Bosea sp. 685]|uniref:class I SAM-dependent methyltransferase n=1 Tax=Bosea sp. 685 TaxID=3080057 RepID=UPI00289301F9|nr:methyltransferase domain-containing protein [Bosea sp. 685]WNJ89605.1 methyltransferase domain-containing protein [Bosea sp. 685]